MDASRKPIDGWLLDQVANLLRRPKNPHPPGRKIAIISTPRCGSKFVCESLSSTGIFGDASEWMNPLRTQAYCRVLKRDRMDVRLYLDDVISRTTSPNGVFTLNFHVDQYVHWKDRGFDLMSLGFDRVIRLQRRDKLAQAYSYAKAMATGQWRSTMEPRKVVAARDVADAAIIKALYTISLWDAYHEENLARFVHQGYWYEDFVADPNRFGMVLSDSSIDGAAGLEFNTRLEVQRDATDVARLSELRAYLGLCGS